MEKEQFEPESPASPAAYNGASGYIKPQHRKPHDSAVFFEEYYYYAQRTREEEVTLESPSVNWREVLMRKKNPSHVQNNDNHEYQMEKNANSNKVDISDEEWTNASRAFRTASWGACQSDPNSEKETDH